MKNENIESAKNYFEEGMEEIERCFGGCGKEVTHKDGRMCDECIKSVEDKERKCWDCGEAPPADDTGLCEECKEKDHEPPTECVECGDELTSVEGSVCTPCLDASLDKITREYKCVSCGEVFEGTRVETPSCDSCGTVADRSVDDTDLSEVQIYLIETGGYVKIGISKSPKKRRNGIQSSTPLPAKLITTLKSKEPEIVEQILHRKFAKYQTPTEREWFELPDEICDILEDVEIITAREAETRF